MSGQTIGAVIGAVVAVIAAIPSGGTSLMAYAQLAMAGMAIGGAIGGMLDPPKGTHTEGAKLQDVSQQTSTYGAVIPRVFGKTGLYGNVFWLENNKLKEVAVTETYGGKGGPPESSQTTYKYYATFAVGLCRGPITAVVRIWVSGKLWYHRGSEDIETLLASDDKETKFKIYYGTEDQMPEPRMQADKGAANCPAYRGLAYIVFYDFDLEPFGNSLAGCQIKVELATSPPNNALSVAPEELIPDNDAVYPSKAIYYNGRYYIVRTSYLGFLYQLHVVDDDFRLVAKNTIPQNNATSRVHYYNGFVFAKDHINQQRIRRYTIDYISNSFAPVPLAPFEFEVLHPVQIITGSDRYIYVSSSSFYGIYDCKDGILYDMGVLGLGSVVSAALYYDTTGRKLYLMLSQSSGEPKLAIFSDISGTLTHLNTHVGAAYPSWPAGNQSFYNQSGIVVEGGFLYSIGSTLGKWDVSDPANISLVTQTAANITHATDSIMLSGGHVIRVSSSQVTAYSKDTLTATNTITRTNVASHNIAVINNGEILSLDRQRGITRFKIGVSNNPAPVTLATIVDSLSDNLIDTAELTQLVTGYRDGGQSTARSMIEQLQGAYPFDVIQDGYRLVAKKRGRAVSLTIPNTDINELLIEREIDNAIVSEVIVNYIDPVREYDINTQSYARIGFQNSKTAELPLTMTATQAKQVSEQLVYLYWQERYGIRFQLPAKYNQLQPADVINITAADGTIHQVRLTMIAYGEYLDCSGKYNAPSVYNPNSEADGGYTPSTIIRRTGQFNIIPLDIPLLDDGLDGFNEPFATYGTANGGSVYISKDNTTYGFSATKKGIDTYGLATNTLSTSTQPLWDKTETLELNLLYGSLASVSELQVLNGENHFAYGRPGRWEIIGARVAVNISSTSWQLSEFIRGRLGTERYTGTHQTNDIVVALTRNLQTIKWSNYGISQYYKTVPFTKTLADVTALNETYTAVNMRPLSPVYAKAERINAAGDRKITWIRRTRYDTGLPNTADSPLFENGENYVIETYNSAFTTLLSTFTSATQSFIYTAAMNTADYGGVANTLYVRIYQISSIVGRGYPLETSLTTF